MEAELFTSVLDTVRNESVRIVEGPEVAVRESAQEVIGERTPFREPALVLGGETRHSAGEPLYEFYSVSMMNPPPEIPGPRYVQGSGENDILVASSLALGGPVGGLLRQFLEENAESDIVIRGASRTTRRGPASLVPYLLRNKDIASRTGIVVSPSAVLNAALDEIHTGREGEVIRIAEIHPGNGELLIAAATLATVEGDHPSVVYHGLETDPALLPERYEPLAAALPPRDDVRGVLDLVAPPADPDRVILTTNPDELAGSPYDVVVLRRPRSVEELDYAAALLRDGGKLVVIPGEHNTSPGGITSKIVSPLPESTGLSNPALGGIQGITGQFVGVLVYRKRKRDAPPREEPASRVPPLSVESVNGAPFLNAGPGRIPALYFIAMATRGAGAECVVVQVPNNVMRRKTVERVSRRTGIWIAPVRNSDEANRMSQWIRSKGVRVITEESLRKSGELTNMIRTATDDILSRSGGTRGRVRGRRPRLGTVLLYGECEPMLLAAVDAFPSVNVSVVLPPGGTLPYSVLGALFPRGTDKIHITRVPPGESSASFLATTTRKSDADVVWNVSWGGSSLYR